MENGTDGRASHETGIGRREECMTTSKAMPRHGKDASGCQIDIRIESQGDVNIYNCTAPAPPDQPCPPSPPTGCPTGPIAPGQCIPLTLGAKPKQSQRTKLNTLLNN